MATEARCRPVTVGFWAPLGSEFPEPCPKSGFFCPGAAADEVNGGGKPVIVPEGSSKVTEEVAVVQQEMTLDVSIDEYNETAVKHELAALCTRHPPRRPHACSTFGRSRSHLSFAVRASRW